MDILTSDIANIFLDVLSSVMDITQSKGVKEQFIHCPGIKGFVGPIGNFHVMIPPATPVIISSLISLYARLRTVLYTTVVEIAWNFALKILIDKSVQYIT